MLPKDRLPASGFIRLPFPLLNDSACVHAEFLGNYWFYFLDGDPITTPNDYAVSALTAGASPPMHMTRRQLRDLMLGWMHAPLNGRLPLVKQAFRLLESLSLEGFVFPPDLMLFRKAIFTLDGVLHDLWPAFDMDAAISRHLLALVQQEFPMRLGTLLFPLADRPENYKSLISNQDLHTLIAHQTVSTLFGFSRQLMVPMMGQGWRAGMP